MADRMTDPNWAGPAAAAFYVANGLRVLPLHPETKEAARRGFGKANSEFCTPPNQFRAGELIAILMGRCPLGDHAGGRQLCGLDLDAPFDRAALESFVGPLPLTLSSKNGAHLYFWITAAQHVRAGEGGLTQGNDVFKTKSAGRGALDLRPAAGGYFLERGDWDPPKGFDRKLIADLPDAAFDALLAARNVKRGRPAAPCGLSVTAFEGDENSPLNALGEPLLNDLARELARLWPVPGQGGGHDLALALGGILADAYGSLDDVADFASRVHYYAQAPDATDEILTSAVKRRSGLRTGVFGWPTLKRMLVAAHPEIPEPIIQRTLNRVKATIPGLDLARNTRSSAVEAFKAAGMPGAEEHGIRDAMKIWAAQQKQNAPEPSSSGAPSFTNLPTEEEQL